MYSRFRHSLSLFLHVCVWISHSASLHFFLLYFLSPTLTINSAACVYVHMYVYSLHCMWRIQSNRCALRIYIYFPLLIFLHSFHFYLIFLTLVRRPTLFPLSLSLSFLVGTSHSPSPHNEILYFHLISLLVAFTYFPFFPFVLFFFHLN